MATLEWKGDQIVANLRRNTMRGLVETAEVNLQEMNELVPHDSGDLESTGKVTAFPNQLAVVISYDTPYAIEQHENLNIRHKDGREAKFMESVLVQNVDSNAKLIFERVKDTFKGD